MSTLERRVAINDLDQNKYSSKVAKLLNAFPFTF